MNDPRISIRLRLPGSGRTLSPFPASLRMVLVALVLGLGATSLGAMQERDWEPKPVDMPRYRELWEESPFTTHVVEVVQVEEEPGFIEDLELIGLHHEGSTPVVWVRDTVQDRTLMVRMGEVSEDGLVLEEVENPSNPAATAVRLRQGSDVGTLKHSAETLALRPSAQPRQREGRGRSEEQAEQQQGRGQEVRGRRGGGEERAQRGRGDQESAAPRRRTIRPRGS